MSGDLYLRPMEENDWDAVMEIEAQSFKKKDAWSKKAYQQAIVEDGARCLVGFDREDGVVAGAVWLIANEVFSLAVRKGYRDLGYGGQLLDAGVAGIDRNRYRFAYLDVRPSLVGALRLYLRQGFTLAGFDPNFYGKKDGALHMMKSFR